MINIGQRIISEDQMNPKMVKGCDKIAVNTNPCECNVKNHVRSDRVSSNDDNDCLKSDGRVALLDSVVRSKNETSWEVIDVDDGAWISKLCVSNCTVLETLTKPSRLDLNKQNIAHFVDNFKTPFTF